MADHLSELRENCEETPDRGESKNRSCVVARDGVPTAVVMDYAYFLTLIARAELLSDPDVIQGILRSGAEILEGKALPLEEALRTLPNSAADEDAYAAEAAGTGRPGHPGDQGEFEFDPQRVNTIPIRSTISQMTEGSGAKDAASRESVKAVHQSPSDDRVRPKTEVLRGKSIRLEEVVLKLIEGDTTTNEMPLVWDEVLPEGDPMSSLARTDSMEGEWAAIVSGLDLIASEAGRRSATRRLRHRAETELEGRKESQ